MNNLFIDFLRNKSHYWSMMKPDNLPLSYKFWKIIYVNITDFNPSQNSSSNCKIEVQRVPSFLRSMSGIYNLSEY